VRRAARLSVPVTLPQPLTVRSRLEERLRQMTPEQQLADAEALHERARQALALADQRARVIEGEGTEFEE
jgi:hypothetical protein